MSIVMVLTSLVLAHHGHSLSAIAISHTFHSVGMFAFTIPLGKLADRIGRGSIMFPGVFVSLVGAALVAFTPNLVTVTLGTFLVGVGWAAANVAATAFIADQVTTTERGRAIGLNDTFAGVSTVFAAFVTGPLIEWYGLPATGAVAMLAGGGSVRAARHEWPDALAATLRASELEPPASPLLISAIIKRRMSHG